MITVSEHVKDLLLHWKQSVPAAGDDRTLRLTLSPAGWEVRPDTPRPGDVIIERDKRPVLLIQDRACDLLRAFTLDCRETVERVRLVLVVN